MPVLTLVELQDRILSRLDNNTPWYSLSTVTSVINEAYRLCNLALGFQQGSASIPSVRNRIWYSMPLPVIIPFRVQFETEFLQKTEIQTLGKSNGNWTTATTETEMSNVSSWIPFGLLTFGIWPADAVGGGQIKVSGITQITPLVNPSDTVVWNQDVLSAFDNYAVHLLQLREPDTIFEQASVDFVAYQDILRQKTWVQGWKMPRYRVQVQQSPSH